MSRRDRRPTLFSWRSLATDPLRKLLALALAIPLWVYLDRQVTKSDSQPFKLLAAEAATDRDQAGDFALRVQVPTESYSIKTFLDAITGEEIGSVRLSFDGPQHMLSSRLTHPTVQVIARTGDINMQAAVFEFDLGDLRFGDAELGNMLVEMIPKRVAVQLERTTLDTVPLSLSRIAIDYPDETRFPDFRARLRVDEPEFSEKQVRIRGAKARIDQAIREERKLFRIDLSQFGASSSSRISAPLQLHPDFANLRVESGPITVSFNLDPLFEAYPLKVPVLLDLRNCPGVRLEDLDYDRYLTVNLRVSGELGSQLFRMSPAELEAWAEQELYVYVRPQAWSNTPEVFFGTLMLPDTRFQRRRHYQCDEQLSVQIRPKKDQ